MFASMSRSTSKKPPRGVTKSVEFPRSKACGTCKGSGSKPGSQRASSAGTAAAAARSCSPPASSACRRPAPPASGAGSIITDPCTDCRGRGYVQERAKLDVTIPAGIDNGMRVRLAGYGEPSPDGGPPGDCYCFVAVHKHKLFEREGTHLILRMPISYSQAALGAAIEVPTLAGPHELKVPAGTQSGEVFRVRGRGLPDPRGGSAGDLHVQTYIEVPKKLTATQEKLLRELAELEKTEVSPHRKSFLERLREYFTPTETTETAP